MFFLLSCGAATQSCDTRALCSDCSAPRLLCSTACCLARLSLLLLNLGVFWKRSSPQVTTSQHVSNVRACPSYSWLVLAILRAELRSHIAIPTHHCCAANLPMTCRPPEPGPACQSFHCHFHCHWARILAKLPLSLGRNPFTPRGAGGSLPSDSGSSATPVLALKPYGLMDLENCSVGRLHCPSCQIKEWSRIPERHAS